MTAAVFASWREPRLRVYDPGARPTSALLWVHGGAFHSGGLDDAESHWVATALCARGILVGAVDYRLASSTIRYPLPLDDVESCWRAFRAHAAAIELVAIGGASAGGNLAAGATLRLVGGALAPSRVVLAYPTLHMVQPEASAALLARLLDAGPDVPRFTPDAIEEMYRGYLGPGGEPTPESVPGLAEARHLETFPPTLIVNSELDELRWSGERFGRALADAGADVTVLTERETTHGHLGRPSTAGAASSLARIAEWLSR